MLGRFGPLLLLVALALTAAATSAPPDPRVILPDRTSIVGSDFGIGSPVAFDTMDLRNVDAWTAETLRADLRSDNVATYACDGFTGRSGTSPNSIGRSNLWRYQIPDEASAQRDYLIGVVRTAGRTHRNC